MLRKRYIFSPKDVTYEKAHEILIRSQLFGGLSEKYITEIEKIAVDKHYDKGDVIFYDGDEGVGFYLVVAGNVSVFKLSPEGKEQILHIVKEGDTIGAVPVFQENLFPPMLGPYPEAILLFFDRTKFIELISGKPDLTMNILALLSARLREFTIQVENLSLKEIPGRLASYLLYLSREQGNKDLVKLNISKVQVG